MDRRALESFVRTDYPRVVAAVGFASGDRAGAEDAVQDVLASLLGSEIEIRDPRAFVVTAAVNRVRSRERRRGAEKRALTRLRSMLHHDAVLHHDAAPPVDAVGDEVLDELRALPRGQREAIALHYLLDMAVDEVATTLGVSGGTIKTQLHRARETLRDRFGPELRDAGTGDTEMAHEEVEGVGR